MPGLLLVPVRSCSYCYVSGDCLRTLNKFWGGGVACLELGYLTVSSALQTKAKAPKEKLNPNSHCPPAASLLPNPSPSLQWLPVKGSICGKSSVSTSLHVHAEEFGAAGFVLGPRLTHKWKEHSR